LRWVASIMTALGAAASAASPAIIRAKTPIAPHRFQRLERGLAGPHSAGASRQHKPLRLTKVMPLKTRRSSTQGQPWLLGKKGSRRAIRSSTRPVKIAHPRPPQTGSLSHTATAAASGSMRPEPRHGAVRPDSDGVPRSCARPRAPLPLVGIP
jgi:hypothetical protein